MDEVSDDPPPCWRIVGLTASLHSHSLKVDGGFRFRTIMSDDEVKAILGSWDLHNLEVPGLLPLLEPQGLYVQVFSSSYPLSLHDSSGGRTVSEDP